MDLALAGRLALADDSVTVDGASTGFPPADDMLTAIRIEPERTLDEWFGERRIGLHRVIDALVESGGWSVRWTLLGRRRYRVDDQARVERDKHWDLTLPAFAGTPEDAAVAALGSMGHLVGSYRQRFYGAPPPEVSDSLLRSAGPQEWMLKAGVEFLRNMRVRYRYTDAVLGSGGSLR